MKRILYLGYYIKKMDWKKFNLFLSFASQKANKSKITLLIDAFFSVFKYNISLLEYFQFRFFEQNKEQRKTWAGTGFMFEYQLKMNPKSERHILDDKRKFYKEYKDFFIHKVATLDELKKYPEIANTMLVNPSGKIVFKVADGNCGIAVQVEKANQFDSKSIVSFMENLHELTILYFTLLPTFIFNYNSQEYVRDLMFEKIIPVKQKNIVFVKYIFFIVNTILSLAISYIYLILVKNFSSTNLNENDLVNFMLGLWSMSISLGTSVIMISCMKRNSLEKSLIFIFPVLQSLIVIYGINWDNFLVSLTNSISSDNQLFLIISSFGFLCISYPVTVYLQKRKAL